MRWACLIARTAMESSCRDGSNKCRHCSHYHSILVLTVWKARVRTVESARSTNRCEQGIIEHIVQHDSGAAACGCWPVCWQHLGVEDVLDRCPSGQGSRPAPSSLTRTAQPTTASNVPNRLNPHSCSMPSAMPGTVAYQSIRRH